MKLNMNRCQLALTALWWGWGILLILLLALLSAQSKVFGDQVGDAWQWFLPNLMPTMMLVGAAAYSQKTVRTEDQPNIVPLFGIAILASALYLLLLTISLLGIFYSKPPLEWLTRTNYWLAPVQGLAASALGVFFTK